MATSASRDTTTGTNYETEVENLLEEFSDHKVESQVWIGKKRNGGKHKLDILVDTALICFIKNNNLYIAIRIKSNNV